MLLSNYIAQLQAQLNEHGDMTAVVAQEDMGDSMLMVPSSITTVEVERTDETEVVTTDDNTYVLAEGTDFTDGEKFVVINL